MPDPYKLLSIHSDITLLRRCLPPGELGRWYPEQRVIVLSPTLTQAEERCTLMHELVHALQDDRGIDDTWLNDRQEKACHELVARALVPIERLIAEARQAADEYQLAEALDVDLDTLNHRLRTLSPFERRYLTDAHDMEEIA